MRSSYLPSSSKHYEDYYIGQVGRGHPVFTGPRNQRGYGLGGILGGLFRSAMPLLKQGAKTLGREAIRTGVGIAQDALEGKISRRRLKTDSVTLGATWQTQPFAVWRVELREPCGTV